MGRLSRAWWQRSNAVAPPGVLQMATNLKIDSALLECALKVNGERSKSAVVTKALQEFIARRQQRGLLALMGKLDWDASFDFKAER